MFDGSVLMVTGELVRLVTRFCVVLLILIYQKFEFSLVMRKSKTICANAMLILK